jgi:cephalosporin hydroxylase
MEIVKEKFIEYCNTPSDINEHLKTLSIYASDCETIIECGVRYCISSWALVYGLLHNNKNIKKILLNDIVECDISYLQNTLLGTDVTIIYEWKNDLELNLEHNYDMILIDTWHVYGQLKRELEKFAPRINKYIIMHDTTVDEIYGETIRMNMNTDKQSIETGFSKEDINCGLGKAIDDFLETNKEWKIYEKFQNNNGLTILKRR